MNPFKIFIFSNFLLFGLSAVAIDQECLGIFKANKIDPQSATCLMTCMTVKLDMSSFTCHDQCDEYCKDPCNDILAGLEKKLKSGLPPHWPLKEKPSIWKTPEKKRVTEAMSQLPDQLIGASPWEVYRMQKSEQFPNPATNATSDPRSIALYDTAFNNPYNLSQVIAHELAHIYFQNLSNDQVDAYRWATNWISISDPVSKKKQWISRSDGYVEEDGRTSPEEDFANNLEYYLFNPKKLKSVTPQAFNWIKNNIDMVLKKGCRYEK